MSLDNPHNNVHMHIMVKKNSPPRQDGAMVLAACTCANLRQASRVVTQVYDAALRPTGLKVTQFTVLAKLANRGDLPLGKLAEVMVMDRTTLTRNLKPLIAKGWVSVEQEPDQRVRRISLSAAGRRVFDQAVPLWRGAQSRLVEGLGRERWAGLLDDLGAAVAVAQGR